MVDVKEFIPESGDEIFDHFVCRLSCSADAICLCFPSLAVVCEFEVARMNSFPLFLESCFHFMGIC